MASQNDRIQTTPSDPGVGPGVIVANGQTYDPPGRYITVSTAGTIQGKLVGDTAIQSYVLPVGTHKLAFATCATATSIVAFITR